MSIRDHIRILKPLPIKESVVTKIRSLTEAYDIFPKSEGEIDTLDIPHNKDNLKALLKDVLSKSDGMADPIEILKKKLLRYTDLSQIILTYQRYQKSMVLKYLLVMVQEVELVRRVKDLDLKVK